MKLPPLRLLVRGGADGPLRACSAPPQSALARGAEDWATWWKSVESEPALGEAVDTRRQTWPQGTRDAWASPGVAYREAALREAALREAGLTEVEIVWQDLEERVLIAVMP